MRFIAPCSNNSNGTSSNFSFYQKKEQKQNHIKLNKGFTLIELLAVIVILAIIAVITPPVILNVIEGARLNSAKDKAWGTIDAARLAYSKDQTSSGENELYTLGTPITFGSGNEKVGSVKITVSGERAKSGTVVIDKDGKIIASALQFGNYYCSTINSKEDKTINPNKMVCSKEKKDVMEERAADKLKENVVTTGDGLYADTTEEGRYIYRGADPNNYIKLGTDIYSIISVESDNTIKVIKNGSIGDKVFDPGYKTVIDGVTSSDSTDGTRYSSTSTDYCYASSASSYSYCKVWGSKTTMLDTNGNNVTQMPLEVNGTLKNLPDKDAYLNTYLNSDWYNSLSSSVKNLIVSHMFNVGVIKVDEANLSNTISQEAAYKWKGKVGLMNASDYVKASTAALCDSVSAYRKPTCYNNSATHNWLYARCYVPGHTVWTIAPISVPAFTGVIYVIFSGSFWANYADENTIARAVAPVFYLSSDIILTGSGTESDPYILKE